MRNLITGIFTVLAGTAIFYGKQTLDNGQAKSRDQMHMVRDSVKHETNQKTPALLNIDTVN
jgi:hypothetical protein